jgi:hypothetical protein
LICIERRVYNRKQNSYEKCIIVSLNHKQTLTGLENQTMPHQGNKQNNVTHLDSEIVRGKKPQKKNHIYIKITYLDKMNT